MNNNHEYELILNHITAAESTSNFRETYEDYKKMAYLFLNHNNKSLFADQILSEYTEGRTLEEIFSWNKDRYVPGNIQERKGKREQNYYDLWSMEVIPVEYEFFHFFFATKLRHIDLLRIDEYLDYHLDNSFKNDLEKYLRFLNITLRKHEKKLLTPEIVLTVSEWIKGTERKEELSGADKPFKTKGRIQREPGDKLTDLSLVQTALLIKFMQDARITLNSDSLNPTQAGKAFHLLTGFSSNNLRLYLGKKGEVTGAKFEDYKELHDIIIRLAKLIEPHIRKKR